MDDIFEIEYNKLADNSDLTQNQKELFESFKNLNIKSKTCFHEAAFTVDQAKEFRGKIKGGHCKNLFLKDKASDLFLIVALEDALIKLNHLHKHLGSKRLSFAKSELMEQYLMISPGSVTPFAIMNNTERNIKIVLDKKMLDEDILNYHPLSNTATTSIKKDDLLKFLKSYNNDIIISELY